MLAASPQGQAVRPPTALYARTPTQRKKRTFKKLDMCKCCPMPGIPEGDEEEEEMICEIEEESRGIFGVNQKEKVEVTVDSGASQSVWPRKMKGVKRYYEKPPKLVAANGTNIPVHGRAVLGFQRGDIKGEMKFWDADVQKPLGAVSAMVDEGNTVIFSRNKSMIRNDRTGEEIEIKRKGGTFVIELNREDKPALKNLKEKKKDKMEIGGMEEEQDKELERMVRERYGDGEVVFRRRAH